MEYTESLIEWTKAQIPSVMSFVLSLGVALIILLVGHKLIKLLIRYIRKSLGRTNIEEGVVKFLVSILKTACYLLLVITAAQRLGLETSSIIAIVGSAGLAIGLSLQGSLSNLAGGVLLLTTKPFTVGDYILVNDMEGVVTGIDIIYTTLTTVDNRKVVMPNGKLANSDIINVTYDPKRRLDLTVPVEYSENIKKVKDILEAILKKNKLVLQGQDISVFINSFEASSVLIGFRAWVATENYWDLRCELMEEVKEAFEENGISIPCEKMKIEVVKEESIQG